MVDGGSGSHESPNAIELGPGSSGDAARRRRFVAAMVASVSVVAIVVVAVVVAPDKKSRVRSAATATPSTRILAVIAAAHTDAESSTSASTESTGVGSPSSDFVDGTSSGSGPTTSSITTSSAAPPANGTRLVALDPADGHVVDTIDPNVVVSGPRSIAVTRDGQRAFVAEVPHQCTGEQRSTTQIVGYSLGDKTSKVVASDAGNPVVSPDGSKLAYRRSPCVGAGAMPIATLVEHDLVGDAPDAVFDSVDPIAFSPDSAQLLVRDKLQRYGILTLAEPTQGPTTIVVPQGLDAFGWIGAKLAGVYPLGADHSGLVTVETGPASAGKPIVEFPSSLDLVDFDESGPTALLLERAGDRTLKRQHGSDLVDITKHVDAAAWLPTVVSATTSTDASTTSISVGTTAAEPTTTTASTTSAAVPTTMTAGTGAAAGSYVVVQGSTISLVDARTGTIVHKLVDDPHLRPDAVSADAKYAYYATKGTTPCAMTPPTAPKTTAGTMSPSNSVTAWDVQRVPLAGGSPQHVTNGFAPAVSADGKWLAVSTWQCNTIESLIV